MPGQIGSDHQSESNTARTTFGRFTYQHQFVANTGSKYYIPLNVNSVSANLKGIYEVRYTYFRYFLIPEKSKVFEFMF